MHLASIGDGGDLVDAEAGAAHGQHGSLARSRIASPGGAGAAHAHLVAPMDLAPFFLGPFGDLRIGLLQPLFDLLGVLLARLAKRLLGRVAPATQVLPHGADRQGLAGPLVDQVADGPARPQGTGDARLLGGFAVEYLLNPGPLLLIEQAARALGATRAVLRQPLGARGLVSGPPARHRLGADPQD